MLTSSSSPFQHKSIRNAIQDEEYHIVRVNEEGTGEIYDLNLSHSTPYASPVTTRDRGRESLPSGAKNAKESQQQHHASDSSAGASAGGDSEHRSHHASSSSSSNGRRILQLPQIVSRRHGNVSSASAKGGDSAALHASVEMKALGGDRDEVQTAIDGAGARMPPIVGELPPSPPLEPEYRNGMENGNIFEATTAKSFTGYDDGSQARRAPRRAYTSDVLTTAADEFRPTRGNRNSILREGSGVSNASTTYLSASSHDGSDDELADAKRPKPSRYTTAPMVAEPGPLLHPSSAVNVDVAGSSSSATGGRRPSPAPSLTSNASQGTPRLPPPTRRNTTGGSTALQKKRPGSVGSVGTQRSRRSSKERESGLPATFNEEQGPPFNPSAVPPLRTGDAGLDEAIAKQYDQMRRQRETKKMREKTGETEQQEAMIRGGTALSRAKSGRRGQEEEPKALIGNVISEGHVNYVLMYNMLTGIRIGVSRCQAKIKRSLTDADYTAKHKFTFDIVGNELTPSAKYDFKFKDYAPWVFRELREYFHLDPADYLLSLTAKYILSELGSPGKSGSFFYFSRDYRFIIKTIRHNEHKFLRSILKEYHLHIKLNPHTLLSRFYGLHRVKLPGGKKIHFVIMNNLFPPHRDIHETYDLKGSAIGREYPEEKAAQKKGAVLKDLNWVKRGRELELGPEKMALFEAQVRSDVALLQRLHIMDYSLLIGLHDMRRGNSEGLRQDALQVVQPESNNASGAGGHLTLRREPTTRMEKEAYALRAAVRRSDAKALGSTSAAKLPERETSDRHHFLFYQDEGGFRSTDEQNKPTDWVYYFGIIDTLTLYSSVKRGEHYFKSLTNNSQMISAIHPVPYGKRFCNFLFSVVKVSASVCERYEVHMS